MAELFQKESSIRTIPISLRQPWVEAVDLARRLTREQVKNTQKGLLEVSQFQHVEQKGWFGQSWDGSHPRKPYFEEQQDRPEVASIHRP